MFISICFIAIRNIGTNHHEVRSHHFKLQRSILISSLQDDGLIYIKCGVPQCVFVYPYPIYILIQNEKEREPLTRLGRNWSST